MKKRMKLLSILLFVVLMSGCVKYNFNMEVGKDKSVTIEIIDAIDVSYSSYSDAEGEATAAETKGFTKEAYETEDWVGYKLTKKYDNIDDISSEEAVTVELTDILNEEKEEVKVYFQKKSSLFKTTYIANFTMDMGSSDGGTYDSYASSMDLAYKIVLPVKSDSNNATSVSEDGKTLTWKLEYGKLNEVKYEFSMVNTAMYIVIVAVVAVVVVGVVLLVVKGKKKPNAGNMNMNNQMPNPAMPPQPMMPQDGQQPTMGPEQPNMMGNNFVNQNPLDAVAPDQNTNMFGQPMPEQNFQPADANMPSLENQPPIVSGQEMAQTPDFGQPAPLPEANVEAAPEVAPVEVPAPGFDNTTDTVVMPPVEEMPQPEMAPVSDPVAPVMETPEMAPPVIDENNNVQ